MPQARPQQILVISPSNLRDWAVAPEPLGVIKVSADELVPGDIVTAPHGRFAAKVRGREPLLTELRSKLREGGLVVLTGPGGVGKSTIAAELVRMAEEGMDGHAQLQTWWVCGDSRMQLRRQLAQVAATLKGSVADRRAIIEATPDGPDRLWRLLENSLDRWLLVIDNADDPDVLAAPAAVAGEGERTIVPTVADGNGWARAGRQGLVLVTSRRHSRGLWGTSPVLKRVDFLSPEDSGEVLLDLAPEGGTQAEATALGDRLGCFPLALHMAGAYLAQPGAQWRKFEHYRAALGRKPETAFTVVDESHTDERTMVTRTWELSLDELARQGCGQARAILRLLSCYAPAAPIPQRPLDLQVIARLLGQPEGAGDEPVVRQLELAIRGLSEFGLIEITRETGQEMVKVNPVIADTNRRHVARPEAGDPEPALVLRAAAVLLGKAVGALSPDRPSDWPRYNVLARHLEALLEGPADGLADDDLVVRGASS